MVRERLTDLYAPGLPLTRGGYSYLLLRRHDIQALRRFRNAQMDVLRQHGTISEEQQERWFDEVVVPAQRSSHPRHMLVSILDDRDDFIGYGGLTPIDWESRRSEVSFLVDPTRAMDSGIYRRDMDAFLKFLKHWAFDELGLNRLFTETYAFRDLHIDILEQAGFSVEERLRKHVATGDETTDSIMHGLLATDWRAR